MLLRLELVVLGAQIMSLGYEAFAETVITAAEEGPASFMEPKFISESEAITDRSKHPCRRRCRDGEPSMECRYDFRLEAYHTMSKACFDCFSNITDCFRQDCIPADGVKRSLVVVNRQMPGPAIEVCLGDRIIVDVHNMLPAESTTMHWHGQHHRSTPYMDGVPYVTQCPIHPGATFRYHYVAATSGTHFWHSHSGFQRGDGVIGPLIVRVPPRLDPHFKYYDLIEHTMIVMDWDHKTGADKFLAHHHADGDNKPVNLLVNGLGRHNGVKTPLATFVVKESVRYRFRVINAGFLNCPIEISIDNHTIYVISTDGNDIQPVEAESLVTYAGERFDFILQANQKQDNYWIRFRGLMDCDERFTRANQVAILRYMGAPEVEPTATVSYERNVSTSTKALQVNALNQGMENNATISIPLLYSLDPDDEANTKDPDYQFYISYDFYAKDNPHFHRKDLYGFHKVINNSQRVFTPQLNYISMKLPEFPLLSQREAIRPDQFCNESSVTNCEDNYCACTHVLQVKLGSVVELVLIDKGFTYDANHPFHLHGHDFRVVAMERVGKNVTVDEVKRLDAAGLIKRKLSQAPIKDTVTVPDGGYTVVRFHANNPGYWLFHCHIEFHVELGMALIFKVGEHEDFPPVPDKFPRCGSYTPIGPPEATTTTTAETAQTTETTTELMTTKKSLTTPTTTTTAMSDLTENETVIREQLIIIRWLSSVVRDLTMKASSASSTKEISIVKIVFSIVTLLLANSIHR
ncbi:laccase-1-like [Neodiprion virginianus]|uniref:laccase-1-like n=1 Tax=Neodiprion virginianus TaxID=2961670 RepID=UPI001EE6E37F|nr:laccase-1-like [Neodiprion virginianus]XP_046614060.1 laccase-1-like [Neodiprion virginianus]